jgi:hypothetical protein
MSALHSNPRLLAVVRGAVVISTGCPGRIWASCVSLKLAVTQKSSSGTTSPIPARCLRSGPPRT